MQFKVLLTCVGGELAPQIINYLKNSKLHKVNVIGVDMSSEAIGQYFCDEFIQVPAGDEQGYIDRILETINKYGVQLIIPGSDKEALILAKNRNELTLQGTSVACSDYEVLKIFTSKIQMMESLESGEFNIPIWRPVYTLEDLYETIEIFESKNKECVIKPDKGTGGRGVYVIGFNDQQKNIILGREKHYSYKTFKESVSEYESYLPSLIMENFQEPVYDIDLLSWMGRPLRTVVRKRRVSSMPNMGHKVLLDNELMKLGEHLIKNYKMSWLHDADVMLDDQGKPYVIEINPRMSGSASVSIAAGIPLMDDLISLAKGDDIDSKIRPVETEVIMHSALRRIN